MYLVDYPPSVLVLPSLLVLRTRYVAPGYSPACLSDDPTTATEAADD